MEDSLNQYRVFLSHATADDSLMGKLVKPEVEKTGAKAFIDSDIDYGFDFRDRIIKELNSSDEFIILFTKSSIERPWVIAELGASVLREFNEDKKIIPVIYGVDINTLHEKGLMQLIGNKQLLDLNDLDKYYEQLAKRVQQKGVVSE